MSNISTTLGLNDRMTQQLNQIADAMDRTVDAFEKLQSASSDPIDTASIHDAAEFLRGMSDALDEATDEIEDTETAMQVMGNTINVTNNYYNELEDAAEDAGKGVDESGESAEKAEKKFSKLGAVMKTVGAAMAAATAAAAGATVKLAKDVINSYGELEQNLGGSEAVFGKYAAGIQKVGTEAYKNLGVSQSEYLANANKMGALFQGSGLSQAQSAEMTTKAMQRAADMASVMGIETSAALEAVTGAAKGNYTMMDNLGVKMDATTLEAYAAAQKLDKKFSEMDGAEKADLAMQYFFENTKQYAGNFADEAMGTISGSFGMLKASYEDLIAGLGNPEADIKQLADNLMVSVNAVLTNVMPVVENIIGALPVAVNGLLEEVTSALPGLLDSVVGLFNSVLDMIISLLPRLFPPIIKAVGQIGKKLVEALPGLASAAIQIVVTLIDEVSGMLPELIPLAVEAIITIAQGLIDNIGTIIEAGQSLLEGLLEGIMAALPQLVDSLPAIVDSIVSFLENNYDTLLQTGIDLLIQLIEGLPTVISNICSRLPEIISSIVSALLGRIDTIVQCGVELLIALIQNAGEIVSIVIGIVPQIITALVSSFASHWGDIKQAGLHLIEGLWAGLKKAWEKVKTWVSGLGHGVVDTIKGIFKINSPSKVMADLGHSIGEGFALGITTSTTEAVTAAQDMSNRVLNATEGIGGHMGFSAAVEGVTTSVIETAATVQQETKIDAKDAELMQEMAEREAINKFTTRKINVDFSGMQNSFTSDVDGEDWFRGLRVMLEDALDSGSEGGD